MNRRVRFELLYASHAAAVKAYALRRGGAARADDVVAEVFVVCWQRFEDVPDEPLPWLLGVARRVLSTQRRGGPHGAAPRERPAAEPPLGPGGREAPAPAVDHALWGALARLRESDRDLLTLIAWEGLSPLQAAVVLGVKPSTARVRLLRARWRLTRELRRAVSAPPPHGSLSMEVSP